MTRVDRLRKLLVVQRQLQSLHETRHAGHVADAAAAASEAADIVNRFDRDGSLAALFPELYNRRIANALSREELSRAMAAMELQHVATATARTNMVERNHRVAVRQEDRETGNRERLEAISVSRTPIG